MEQNWRVKCGVVLLRATLMTGGLIQCVQAQEELLSFTPITKPAQNTTSVQPEMPARVAVNEPAPRAALIYTLPTPTPVKAMGSLPVAMNGSAQDYFLSIVNQALNHSPEVRAALANVNQSSWNVKQVKGARYPQLKVGMTTPFDSFGDGTSQHNSTPGDTSANISLTTSVFDWGEISARQESALQGLNSATLAVKESREQIAYNVLSELLNLSRYQSSLKVAEDYVTRMKSLSDMLAQISLTDQGRASEYTQAKAKLLSAQASKEQLQHQYAATEIKLKRYLGDVPVIPEALRLDDTLISGKSALASLSYHPSLLRGEAEAKAADAQADSLKAAGLPKANWVISKSTAKDVNGNESAWYTGLNVEWNAFSGGSVHAAQQAAKAQASIAREQVRTTRLELEYKINNMIELRDSSLVRAKDYVRLSVESDKVRQMFYEQWYHLGKRTLLDVLSAESDHFNNQISAVNNRYDGYIGNISIMSNAAILLNWLTNMPLDAGKNALPDI